MISDCQGDLLAADVDALVNAVNSAGDLNPLVLAYESQDSQRPTGRKA